MGWTRVGVIPGFALFPDGGLCDTVFFWKTPEDPGDGGAGEEQAV